MSQILSPLLSTRENGLLYSVLSHEGRVLECGIVQLVNAAPPQTKEWKSHCFGVLCLIQDEKRNSTFMRLYHLKGAIVQWEQELYSPFKYSETCSYFHTFPGDECQMGINFADKKEAKQFYIAVQKQIKENKASNNALTRRCSMGPILDLKRSETKAKLENCLRTRDVQKRNASRDCLDSNAKIPENKPAVASQTCGVPQMLNLDEDSVSLAQRKGPLPPIPLHARLKLTRSNSLQKFDSRVLAPSWAPPPPSFQAPAVPRHSVAKDSTPTVLKKSHHFNGDSEDESVYDEYL